MTLTDCFVRFKCPTKSRMKTTWRIEAKTTHMVNHVIKICDVILGPHNVRNGSYKRLAARFSTETALISDDTWIPRFGRWKLIRDVTGPISIANRSKWS